VTGESLEKNRRLPVGNVDDGGEVTAYISLAAWHPIEGDVIRQLGYAICSCSSRSPLARRWPGYGLWRDHVSELLKKRDRNTTSRRCYRFRWEATSLRLCRPSTLSPPDTEV
jgi:hypothetical protein